MLLGRLVLLQVRVRRLRFEGAAKQPLVIRGAASLPG